MLVNNHMKFSWAIYIAHIVSIRTFRLGSLRQLYNWGIRAKTVRINRLDKNWHACACMADKWIWRVKLLPSAIPPEKKKGVVYEVQCHDCDEVCVGETGRTLKKQISERKQAVRRGDRKNGIAVHVMDKGHTIKWEEANVRSSETGYWRKVQEAIRIQRQPNTMNLDCGMILSSVWTPALRLSWQQQFNSPYLFIRHARACVSIFIQPIYAYCFCTYPSVVQLTKASKPKRPDANYMCYVYRSWKFQAILI